VSRKSRILSRRGRRRGKFFEDDVFIGDDLLAIFAVGVVFSDGAGDIYT
jgi:hypothetical protein